MSDATVLWERAFASVTASASEAAAADRLRASLAAMRLKATALAATIPESLPHLTVHDETHWDALWELADEIAYPTVTLSPLEAYVFGAALLVHDLGMALASYPHGRDELEQTAAWRDAFAFAVKQGEEPTSTSTAAMADARSAATRSALRLRHSLQAEILVKTPWTNASGPQYLIEDIDLRVALARSIGRIAASHHWPLEVVEEQFGGAVVSAPTFLPRHWRLDELKLACLLRTCDVLHVDARRAPRHLLAARQPSGVSALHWQAQSRVFHCRRDGDRMIASTAEAFQPEDAHAWWLLHDILRYADRELRAVDALLADRKANRFSARAVAGVENPARLAKYIPVDGWFPVDACIHVTDVASVVDRLALLCQVH